MTGEFFVRHQARLHPPLVSSKALVVAAAGFLKASK